MHVNDYSSIQEIFEKSGKVKAVLHGHVHEERFAEVNGIQYLSQLGMVDYEGLENNSFAIVTCTERQLQLDGYKRTMDLKMELS